MVNDISESYICVLNPEAAYKNGEEVATPHPPKLWSVFKQQSLNAELRPPPPPPSLNATAYHAQALVRWQDRKCLLCMTALEGQEATWKTVCYVYNGEGNFMDWIDHFEIVAALNN